MTSWTRKTDTEGEHFWRSPQGPYDVWRVRCADGSYWTTSGLEGGRPGEYATAIAAMDACEDDYQRRGGRS